MDLNLTMRGEEQISDFDYVWSHTTNIKVRELVVQHIERHDSLLTVAKKRKLRWFGYVTRAKGTLANIIL
jgi:hypothetical protein